MTWEVNSVNVNSIDAKLYDSPFSDYAAHQARNGSKIRMAHANTLFTPTRTAEELIPRSVPMPSKEETMRFQLDAGKMTNMIPGAQVDLPKTSLTSKDVPAVPVAPKEPAPVAPVAEPATPEPVSEPSPAQAESYHTPKWQGVRARTAYLSDRKYQRDGRKDERYHRPKWQGARARTGYMTDRKTEKFENKGVTALVIIVVILAVLALAGFFLWKFIWVPKHKKTTPEPVKEAKPTVTIHEEEYIAPVVDGEPLFGGKKAKKSKKSKKSKKAKKSKGKK